jgi:hypothetical protein
MYKYKIYKAELSLNIERGDAEVLGVCNKTASVRFFDVKEKSFKPIEFKSVDEAILFLSIIAYENQPILFVDELMDRVFTIKNGTKAVLARSPYLIMEGGQNDDE